MKLNVPPITDAALKLSDPMVELLGRVAGHKYGWSYISRREIVIGDALVRRGLCEWGANHGRDHWDCPAVVATDAGLSLFRSHWPFSPAALERYEDSPLLATDWAGKPLAHSTSEER